MVSTDREGGRRGNRERRNLFTFLMSEIAKCNLHRAASPRTGCLSVLRKFIVTLFLLVICLYTLSLINI
jgi:hypothetical protein